MKNKIIPPLYKRIKHYEIKWHPESLNSDAYFQVLGDKKCLRSFPTRPEAEKYIQDCKNTVILRTKRIGEYFQGVIKKGYFPLDGNKFFVACTSASGGGKKVSLLNVLDFKADTEKQLLTQLHTFKRKHNLILERL